MKVHQLPDDIFSSKAELDSPVIIHSYIAVSSHFRDRSVLNRNAVSLVISGEKTIRFAEKSVNTSDHEIHFLSAGNNIASFDISKRKEFKSILIFFDDKELADFSVNYATLIQAAQKKYKPLPTRYVSLEKDEFIRSYIGSIQLIMAGNGQFSVEMRRLKLRELLLYLLENRTASFLPFLCRGKQLENEMALRKVVEGNIMENLTLDEMAFLCNTSPSTFKRQFGKIYKTSPTAWFLEQKMKMAEQLLTTQKERPGEIWFKVGFDSHAGFTKSFKKRFGVSPKDYVKKLIPGEQLLAHYD